MIRSSKESGVTVIANLQEQKIKRIAPAKINLTLAVLGRRPDGFHDLESWVVRLAWCDILTVAAANAPSLTLTGSTSGVPHDETNLARRAACLLADAVGRPPAVAIHLQKEIPPGAGLGGGSSDAAAVLLALNDLWALEWPIDRLSSIAAKIGSDVPLFLHHCSAVLRGRGELVEPLPDAWRGWLAIVVPPYSVATAAVYHRWTTLSASRPASQALAQPWRTAAADAHELMARLFNDLEPAAFAVEPRLGSLHATLDGLHGRPVRMTGSGSCLFTLFDTEEEARTWGKAVSCLLQNNERIRVTPTG